MKKLTGLFLSLAISACSNMAETKNTRPEQNVATLSVTQPQISDILCAVRVNESSASTFGPFMDVRCWPDSASYEADKLGATRRMESGISTNNDNFKILKTFTPTAEELKTGRFQVLEEARQEQWNAMRRNSTSATLSDGVSNLAVPHIW